MMATPTLLTIPFEIRAEILDYVLEDFALSIEGDGKCVPYTPKSHRTLATLPLVNRQLRRESLHLLNRRPKLLAFRMPFIPHLVPVPAIVNASRIRVVIMPFRFGSQVLLYQLPNLKAIGVCRNALGSPDLIFQSDGRIRNFREFLVSHVATTDFIRTLFQQWLFRYFYSPERKAKIWCRVVPRRAGSAPVTVVREAVWIDLDQREQPGSWHWCEPTEHSPGERLDSARYNPPIVGTQTDRNLDLILKWWSAESGGVGLNSELVKPASRISSTRKWMASPNLTSASK